MESNPHEDSKSSSEETDRSEQACDDTGTGRSYECVFCKRGFTTAQALGGHMNIHRKDRAKNRPSSAPNPVISDKVDHESYGSYRSYSTVQSHPNHYAMSSEVLNYQTFLPAPSWGTERPLHPHHSNFIAYGRNFQHLNPFGDDVYCGNLGLQVGSSLVADDNKEKREGTSEEDELDLELRLGHDP